MTTYTDPAATLTDHLDTLLAIDRILHHEFPESTSGRRALIAIEILRKVTTEPRVTTTTCPECHGAGERIHGWAMCPAPCVTCDGSGVVLVAAAEGVRHG